MQTSKPRLSMIGRVRGKFVGAPKLEPAPFPIPKNTETKIKEGPIRIISNSITTGQTQSQKVAASDVREFREIMRELYGLNVYISNLDNVFEGNKEIVAEKQNQAIAARKDLRETVEQWFKGKSDWSENELKIITELHERIFSIQETAHEVEEQRSSWN